MIQREYFQFKLTIVSAMEFFFLQGYCCPNFESELTKTIVFIVKMILMYAYLSLAIVVNGIHFLRSI